jgi:hypothetical protein
MTYSRVLQIDQNTLSWLKSRMKEKWVILKNDIFFTTVTQATDVINVGCFGGVSEAQITDKGILFIS